jgi:hypothetical protein
MFKVTINMINNDKELVFSVLEVRVMMFNTIFNNISIICGDQFY